MAGAVDIRLLSGNKVVKEQLNAFLTQITQHEFGLEDLRFEGLLDLYQIVSSPARGTPLFSETARYRVRL
jgi:hypothetical protein